MSQNYEQLVKAWKKQYGFNETTAFCWRPGTTVAARIDLSFNNIAAKGEVNKITDHYTNRLPHVRMLWPAFQTGIWRLRPTVAIGDLVMQRLVGIEDQMSGYRKYSAMIISRMDKYDGIHHLGFKNDTAKIYP